MQIPRGIIVSALGLRQARMAEIVFVVEAPQSMRCACKNFRFQISDLKLVGSTSCQFQISDFRFEIGRKQTLCPKPLS
jgi:hypothetical protein